MNKFERYNPNGDLPQLLMFDFLTDIGGVLTAGFYAPDIETKRLKIVFENHFGYRNFNESERLSLFRKHPEVTVKWSSFKGKRTDFCEWLSSESLGVVDTATLNHFLFVTPDEVLEVIDDTEPKVLWESKIG